jgi:hypothetical protein
MALNAKIQAFWSDQDREFLSLAFTEILNTARIYRMLIQAYTHHKNGISKHENRTLLEKTSSMVFEAQHLVSSNLIL